jgi:hypothetical protein
MRKEEDATIVLDARVLIIQTTGESSVSIPADRIAESKATSV